MRDIRDINAVRPGTNLLAEFGEVFLKDAQIPRVPIGQADGVQFGNAAVEIKLLMVADRMHMLKVFFKKGTVVPRHVHSDHSTVVCLQRGALRVHIGAQVFSAKPGDVWQHPRGVPHFHEALEDSYVIEIKSPASKTW
ncbi:MAG TPA: cupin domain-containing protein [Ramlibacter sp.]|nr:cupin domain-containing protein [Ramlibacter sp.]